MFVLLVVACSTLVLLAADEKTESVSSPMRDPMSKVKKSPVKDVETQQTSDDINRVQEIQQVLSRCRIEGIAISGDERCVVINDAILAEGDRVLPDSDVKIGKIEEGKITFVLDKSEVEFILTPVEEDVIPM
jgi:hypothetical protein